MEKRPKGRQKSQLLGWTKNIVHSVLKQIIIKKIYVCKKCFLFVRMKSQKILTYRITGTIKTKFSGKFQNLSVAKAKLLRNLKVVALLCCALISTKTLRTELYNSFFSQYRNWETYAWKMKRKGANIFAKISSFYAIILVVLS